MNRLINILSGTCLMAILLLVAVSCSGDDKDKEQPVVSTKKERNFIKEGTQLYGQQRYAEAEVSYNKALEINPDNHVAKFNLASSFIKQRGEDLKNKEDSLLARASVMLAELKDAPNLKVSQAAYYDRGNLAYKSEDYGTAVELYKDALRRDPTDDMARQNLRMAQLKLQEQQQNQNKDQNNQDQDKNQQDKDQQQQQQQQQNQDQQNQDKDNQDQQNGQQDKKEEQKQQPQQQKGGLSDANAQQILKAMEDKENATRQKVEKMKQGQQRNSSRRQPEKPW